MIWAQQLERALGVLRTSSTTSLRGDCNNAPTHSARRYLGQLGKRFLRSRPDNLRRRTSTQHQSIHFRCTELTSVHTVLAVLQLHTSAPAHFLRHHDIDSNDHQHVVPLRYFRNTLRFSGIQNLRRASSPIPLHPARSFKRTGKAVTALIAPNPIARGQGADPYSARRPSAQHPPLSLVSGSSNYLILIFSLPIRVTSLGTTPLFSSIPLGSLTICLASGGPSTKTTSVSPSCSSIVCLRFMSMASS